MRKTIVLLSVAAMLSVAACQREESAVSQAGEEQRNEKADAAFSQAPASPSAATPAASAAASRTIIDVNGETITEADFAAAIESLPERMKPTVQSAAGRRALADELVRLKLLEQEGRRMGVEKEGDVARAIDMSTSNIIATAALRKLAEQAPSDEELKALYEQNKKQYETVRARQITIAYEGGAIPARSGQAGNDQAARAKAVKAAARLSAGESFEKVAGDVSDDPMLAQSGGLMVMRRGEVPDNVEKAVFGAAEGSVTAPVKSDIGYHVFQVVKKETPGFEELRQVLARQARSTRVEQIVEQLKGKAKVNLDESFIDNPGSSAQKAPAAAPAGS